MDVEFHELILNICGNNRLIQIRKNLSDQTDRYRIRSLSIRRSRIRSSSPGSHREWGWREYNFLLIRYKQIKKYEKDKNGKKVKNKTKKKNYKIVKNI